MHIHGFQSYANWWIIKVSEITNLARSCPFQHSSSLSGCAAILSSLQTEYGSCIQKSLAAFTLSLISLTSRSKLVPAAVVGLTFLPPGGLYCPTKCWSYGFFFSAASPVSGTTSPAPKLSLPPKGFSCGPSAWRTGVIGGCPWWSGVGEPTVELSADLFPLTPEDCVLGFPHPSNIWRKNN